MVVTVPAPVIPQPSQPPLVSSVVSGSVRAARAATDRGRGAGPVAALYLAAGAATAGALIPSYYRAGGSLASQTPQLLYNLPAACGWLIAGILALIPTARLVGAGLGVGVTAVWFSAYLGDVGYVATGGGTPAAGFDLSLVGLVASLAATAWCLAGVRRTRSWTLTGRGITPVWALTAGAGGVVYGVGDSMNWVRTQIHATVAGLTFRGSGSPYLNRDCCTLLDQHGWSLAGEVLLLIAAVAVPLVAACLLPAAVGTAVAVGAASALFAGPLSSLAQIKQHVSAASLGYTADQVQQAGLLVTQRGLPGLWIAVGAIMAILLVATGRAISGASGATRPG